MFEVARESLALLLVRGALDGREHELGGCQWCADLMRYVGERVRQRGLFVLDLAGEPGKARHHLLELVGEDGDIALAAIREAQTPAQVEDLIDFIREAPYLGAAAQGDDKEEDEDDKGEDGATECGLHADGKERHTGDGDTQHGEDYNVFGKRVVHSAPFRMRPPIVWSKCAQTSCEAEV